MIYETFISTSIILILLWSKFLYKFTIVNSKSKISWHRLIDNNIYVVVLKTKLRCWEIEFCLNDKGGLITSELLEEDNILIIHIPKNKTIRDIIKHISILKLPDKELILFFKGLIYPEITYNLFKFKGDFENYNELIFYLTTSLTET